MTDKDYLDLKAQCTQDECTAKGVPMNQTQLSIVRASLEVTFNSAKLAIPPEYKADEQSVLELKQNISALKTNMLKKDKELSACKSKLFNAEKELSHYKAKEQVEKDGAYNYFFGSIS